MDNHKPSFVLSGGHPIRNFALFTDAGRKLVDNKAAAYVCQNFTCKLPTPATDELIKLLSSRAE